MLWGCVGKTTLFRILLGKLPVTGGEVYINESPANLRALQGRTGFVPQVCLLLRLLFYMFFHLIIKPYV